MKRTPINRLTPIRRGGRIKPVSAKRRRENAEVNDLAVFAATCAGQKCWFCNHNAGSEIHHVFGRNFVGRHHLANLFWLCSECHSEYAPCIKPQILYRLKKLKQPWACDDAIAKEMLRAKNGRIDL